MRALVAILVVVAAPALAQGTSALRRHDINAPIDVDASRVELVDGDRQALLSGGVKITQGRMTLTADNMKVFYERTGDAPTVTRLDARGEVTLVSPSERARGDTGIYDVERRLITLVGGVTLNQGQSVLRGQRLAIDLASGRSTLDGGGARPAPGAPAGGRVTGRFVVPPRTGN